MFWAKAATVEVCLIREMIFAPERTGEERSCQPLPAGVSWSFLTGIQEGRLTGQLIAPFLFRRPLQGVSDRQKTSARFFCKVDLTVGL
jgi:hypothetical protein